MEIYDRVYETVDLDAIKRNMQSMTDSLKPGMSVIGVVKADGYGMGSVAVARAIDPYVWGYGTASIEEALELRENGISKPVLVLGTPPRACLELFLKYDIRLAVYSLEKAELINQLAGRLGKKAVIHLAVDTGMSRIGFQVTEENARKAARICCMENIETEGMFTHFARADETDKEATKHQIQEYNRFYSMVQSYGVSIPVLHCANSAGILEGVGTAFNCVRAGISIYGCYPSDEVERKVSIEPVMELKTHIAGVRTIKAGTPVGYGGTVVADREMRVATIPVGYGDGDLRNLSGKGEVLIRGKRAPILGRVCMDQFMVDVSHIPGAGEDDLVTLIGKDQEDEISVEELARKGEGFHYEILCCIGKRVPRIYLADGKVCGRKDYFKGGYLWRE